LRVSELLVAHGLSPGSSVLATAGPDPIVVSSPRGAGRIVVFGAVDAWRWRAADDDGFARFWRAMLLGEAAAVVPRLAVDVEPTLVRPGERVQVRARLRATELRTTADVVTAPSLAAHIARASDPRGEPVRLWPTAQPGVFEGEWTASGSGDVDVTVTMGTATADATLTVDPDVTRASEPDVEAAAIAARGSGGAARPLRDLDAVVREIAARFPAQPVRAVAHPMRSPWWLLPFAAALTFEWAWRRTRGLQ
jgi:hypothetical protein